VASRGDHGATAAVGALGRPPAAGIGEPLGSGRGPPMVTGGVAGRSSGARVDSGRDPHGCTRGMGQEEIDQRFTDSLAGMVLMAAVLLGLRGNHLDASLHYLMY